MTDIGEPQDLDEETLWRLHATDLVRYATLLVGPLDAPDLVSGAFMRVVRSGRTMAQPRAYLMRAVTNAAASQHRSQRRRQVRDLHAVLPIAAAEHESHLDIRRAVATLSVQQRAVVYFTFWEDLDSTQIGDVLGITPATVRRHLARARFHLRKVLS